MLALAERLPRDRFTPELIVRDPGGPYPEAATKAGIGIRAFEPTASANGAAPAGGLRPRAARALRLIRLIRAARYDIREFVY